MLSEIEGVKQGEDPEHIHRMRVASRRLRTDLRIFRSYLGRKKARRWRKAARSVTISLGEARDLDVQIEFLERFVQNEGPPTSEGMRRVIGTLVGRRDSIQPDLVEFLDSLRTDPSIAEMVSELQEEVAPWNDREIYSIAYENAALLVQETIEAARSVHDPADKSGHHALRIAGKRLRYTLEAFRTLYPDRLKDPISTLKELQDIVGELHDSYVWLERMPLLEDAHASDDEALAALGSVNEFWARRMKERYEDLTRAWERLESEGYFTDLLACLRKAIVTSMREGREHPPSAIGAAEELIGSLGLDLDHMRHVRNISLSLFDLLMPIHDLGGRDRDILELAALLHDIGLVEGGDGHQRRALDAIMSSPVPMSDRKRPLVACVARYHGERGPCNRDRVFSDLKEGERDRVRALSAILAMGDSLDYSHDGRVEVADADMKEGEVTIRIVARQDWSMERMAFDRKKAQFEKYFDRRAIVHE